MAKNVGFIDKTVRLVMGLLIIALGLQFGNWWGAFGLVPILTAIIGWCPLYVPLKLSTNKPAQDKASD